MTPQPQQQDNLYRITRWDLEEYYDAIALINGKPEADRMWERIERNTRSRPAPSAEPKFNSTDLLLLANDEWKRREERKHNHEQKIPWCVGFINGFLTDKKWARDWLDKIQNDAEEKLRSSSEVQHHSEVRR